VPDGLFGAAAEQARLLGQSWVGGAHVLLVLLARPSIAFDTLDELGVTHAAAQELVAAWRVEDEPAARGVRSTPEMHAVTGRAEAFAAMDGVRPPAPQHWLLALVWADRGGGVQLLHALGVSQAAVLDGLRRSGVRVPDLDPPQHKPWRGRSTIEVDEDEIRPLLNLLIRDHPPGSEWRWGFNWTRDEPRRGIFLAEEGIDLDAAFLASRSVGDDLT
jgi:hypothetical protein